MRRDIVWFVMICLLNVLICVVYLLWNLVWKQFSDEEKDPEEKEQSRKEQRTKEQRTKEQKTKEQKRKEQLRKGAPEYIMKTVVMLLCPVVGVLFFSAAWVKVRFFSFGNLDLSDVEFGKKKSKIRVKADEERERNIVPIEESILVSDTEKMRANMINVLLGVTDDSLSSIALALNSDDSEVAHYAAAMLQNKLDEFRETVGKQREQLRRMEEHKDEETKEQRMVRFRETELLIRYMNFTLRQRVLSDIEQSEYVGVMDELCETLYQENRAGMKVFCYEWIFYRSLEIKSYEKAVVWSERLAAEHPEELSAYTTRMKLYFESGKKAEFFDVLSQLKKSTVTIDKQTLEMIRMMHE